MDLSCFKIGGMWLLKAAVLVGLSLIVIFWLSPKAEAAMITGDLITSGGVPVVRIDENSTLSFTETSLAGRFWGYIGSRVKADCEVRNSTMFELKSVTVINSDEKIWQDSGAVFGEQSDLGLIVRKLDRIQGRLLVRHAQPAVDIFPMLLYGGYSMVTLGGLDSAMREELIKLAGGYGGEIVAEGELDGLTMAVDNLWVNGIQRRQLGFTR